MLDAVDISAILATSIITLSSIFTFKVYRRHQFKEYLWISISLFLGAMIPLTYVVFFVVTGSEYNTLRTAFGQYSIILSGIGLILIFYISQYLSGSPKKSYHNALLFISGIGLGLFHQIIGWSWSEELNEWVPHNTIIGILGAGLFIIIYVIELIIITRRNYILSKQNNSIEEQIAYRLLYYGWIISLISLFELIIERLVFNSNTPYWVAIYSIGSLLVALSLLIYPYSMIPKNIGAKYFIVSDKVSGLPMYEHNFVGADNGTTIISGAMSAILTILGEITNQSDIPREIGYIKHKITIEENSIYIAYLVSDRTINPVRVKMGKFLEIVEKSTDDQLNDFIETEMNFMR